MSTLNLKGEFECKLDIKSRFVFPVALKKQIPAKNDEYAFVINRGIQSCLVLHTSEEWDVFTNEISQLNIYIKKEVELLRYFYRGATDIVLDKAGRLLIPRNLLVHAGIDKDITLFAFRNRIEIWDTKTYCAMINDEPGDFSTIAEELLGRKNNAQNNSNVS